MRAKQPYRVLSFATTQQALAWEKQCAAQGVPGRLIPLPREISAGCGPCLADAAGGLACMAVPAYRYPV